MALALENDKFYGDGKGQEYYIDQVLNQNSEKQKALRDVVKNYDPVTAIWPEVAHYSIMVTDDMLEIYALMDKTLNNNLLEKSPTIEHAALANFNYLFPNGFTTAYGDAKHRRLRFNSLELLISDYRNMRGTQAFKVNSIYPTTETPNPLYSDFTLSDVTFIEPSTDATQQRLTATVRTGETSGYFIDIFRSSRNDGKDKKHEYLFHSQGETIVLKDLSRTVISTSETDELSSEKGDLVGYDYFENKRIVKTSRISLWGFYDLWEKAKSMGEVTVPRDNVLFFETNTKGEFTFNTSRVLGLNPLDPFDLSKAETIGRKQCIEVYQFLKNYALRFENATLVSTAPHIGIRESRHPHAKYVLTANDLVTERKLEKPVAVGGYPIDIHSPDGGTTDSVHLNAEGMYYIAMEALLVNEVENMVLAGRAIGADHHANAAIRVTPIAMSIGQGAGTLAGLAAIDNINLEEVPYEKLAEVLKANQVYLGD